MPPDAGVGGRLVKSAGLERVREAASGLVQEVGIDHHVVVRGHLANPRLPERFSLPRVVTVRRSAGLGPSRPYGFGAQPHECPLVLAQGVIESRVETVHREVAWRVHYVVRCVEGGSGRSVLPFVERVEHGGRRRVDGNLVVRKWLAGQRVDDGRDTEERSPDRNASGGTRTESVRSFGRRTPSNVAKKNDRFETIGPPIATPKLSAFTSGLIASPAAFLGANLLMSAPDFDESSVAIRMDRPLAAGRQMCRRDRE